MKKIIVHLKDGKFNIIEVAPDTYIIIERKVIESVTENHELRQHIKESTNLQVLMKTSITEQMVHDSIIETVNNLKTKQQ